ncbi:MAG: CDC27 family protein [Saprospiraceae bacterium]
MNDLKKNLNSSDPNIQDQAVQKGIKQVFDKKLRTELANDLQMQYGLQKEEHIASVGQFEMKSKGNVISIRKWMAIAASLLILVFAYQWFMASGPSIQEQANIYAFAEQPVHPGAVKGGETLSDNYTQALVAFNEGNWKSAFESFKSQVPMTAETAYYTALSAFQLKNYPEAINLLTNNVPEESVYGQERNWYLATALILNDQVAEGKEILSQIKTGEWKYAEAQLLLKAKD